MKKTYKEIIDGNSINNVVRGIKQSFLTLSQVRKICPEYAKKMEKMGLEDVSRDRFEKYYNKKNKEGDKKNNGNGKNSYKKIRIRTKSENTKKNRVRNQRHSQQKKEQKSYCPKCGEEIWDFADGYKINKCWNCGISFDKGLTNDELEQIKMNKKFYSNNKTSKVKNTKRVKVSLSEDEVLEDILKEFSDDTENDPDIKEEIELSFTARNKYGGTFTTDGIDYEWIISEDEAERMAEEFVADGLATDPGMFNQDWLCDYIEFSNTDCRLLVLDLTEGYTDGLDDEELWEMSGIEPTGEEDDDELEDLRDKAREIIEENEAEEAEEALRRDPFDYLVEELGIYSREDFYKTFGENINIYKAAEDAVRLDGWAHFLSSYDGNYETTPNGVVYFRV